MRRILLIFISLYCYHSLWSQNISVSSFMKLPNDLDARVNAPLRDQNGDICAIIKVVTTETGFSWDSDQLGIIKAEKKTGEWWLYVPFGAKRLTIKHDQLGVLRNYTYPEPIEKACVYELKITTAKVKTIIEEQELVTTWLTLKSNPEGADVYINNIQKGITNYTEKLMRGKYTYRIEKPLYHADAGTFEITGEESNGKKLLTIDLKPAFGYLKLNSLPEDGAKVILDDMEMTSTTPFTSEKLKSGKHSVTVKMDMYQPKSIEVSISDGQTTIENITLSPNFAKVTIVTQPEADIYLDGIKIGSGSYSARVLAGIHTFEAKKESHYPDKKEREVTLGNDLSVNLTLQPQLGDLEIVSTPIEATVSLNGVEKGTTPITLKKLLVGNYELQLSKEGFSKTVNMITIKEGQRVAVHEVLKAGANVSKQAETISGNKANVSSSISGSNVTDVEGNVYTYVEGNVYKIVTIGTQVWMAENLKTTKYNDGTAIPLVTDNTAWANLATPGYSWYNKAATNKDTYGALYNWYTVNTKKLCPNGWHVPSDTEWTTLITFLGGENGAGGKLKETGFSHWLSPNTSATNTTGFTALPGGRRYGGGTFSNIGYYGHWWSSSEYSTANSWYRYMTSRASDVNRNDNSKQAGFSVRCLRDY